MPIDSKDIAFAHVPSSLADFSPTKGSNSVIYRFDTAGKHYLAKELKEYSYYYKYISRDPVELAGAMNHVHQIVKRHYKE